MIKIALVICTKDRPKDLDSLFKSINTQKRKPDLIVVVDGSDTPVAGVLEAYNHHLNIEYVTVRPPGLTKQRNVGISKIPAFVDVVGFLDDDIVLEENALLKLEEAIISNPNVAGFGLVINNQANLQYSLLREMFFMDKLPGGVFTRSGINAAIRPVNSDLFLDWVYGGATFWRLDILKNFSFDEWYSGVGYFEDVDFSFRVSRKNKILLCSQARCWHYHHPVKKEKLAKLGQWQIVAWWYFSKKAQIFNKYAVLWSMLGVTLSNFLIGIIKPSSNRLRAAFGNLLGFKVIAFGNVLGFKGFQK